MAAGVFGYLGYDMVRLMEELPASHPDPIGIPDAVLIRPTLVVVFDAVKDSITVVTPVRPEPGIAAKAALARATERLAGVVDALDRPLDKAAAGHAPGPLDIPPKSNTSPAEFRSMVQNGQGLHPGRRYFPGGAVAAFRSAVHAAAARALPRAAPRQSGAVSVFSRLRRLCDRRIEPRGAGAAARRHGDDPAARRHPAARRDAARGQGAGGRTPGRSEGARRASHAARPRQRNDVGRVSEIGSVTVDRSVLHRALQPCHAHRLQRRRPTRREIRCARCAGRRLSGRHGVGRAQGAGDADHRRVGEGKARALCRLRRLFLRRGRDGYPASCCAPR